MSSYVNTLKTIAYFDMENNFKILALNVINILNLFLIFVSSNLIEASLETILPF